MGDAFLLSRALLYFQTEANSDLENLINNLSAVAFSPDGSLWLGSDETTLIERLSPAPGTVFDNHRRFAVSDFIDLLADDEIDIEGMDYADGYLWFVGSHSLKRKKAKGKSAEDDIERLAQIGGDVNRYLLGRIPVKEGILFKVCSHPENPEIKRTAGCLQRTKQGNSLTAALQNDEHLGAFLSMPLAGKENGFDIEGLAVRGNRVFIGLRGPVLRGWAIILEVEIEATNPEILTLKERGSKNRGYRKHFVDLNGLGVRDLYLEGEDLIILAGATMTMAGAMKVFRLKNILQRSGDSLSGQESGELSLLFDLPFQQGLDNAEGLAMLPCLGQQKSLFVVYDSPNPNRRVGENAIFADIFKV